MAIHVLGSRGLVICPLEHDFNIYKLSPDQEITLTSCYILGNLFEVR